MSFKKVILYDKEIDGVRTPDTRPDEPFDFQVLRNTPSANNAGQFDNPIHDNGLISNRVSFAPEIAPSNRLSIIPQSNDELKIDENLFKFIEDIVKRYLERNLANFIKGYRPKRNLKTNKVITKKKPKKPLIVSNSTNKSGWIFK